MGLGACMGPRSPRLFLCPAVPKLWLTGFGWLYYWQAMLNRIQDLDSGGPSLRSRIWRGRRCHAGDGHALRD